MAGEEMVIFTRTFDLLDWLLPITNRFPPSPPGATNVLQS